MKHTKLYQKSPITKDLHPLTEHQITKIVDAVIILREVNEMLKKITATYFAEEVVGMTRQGLDLRIQERKRELQESYK